MVKLGKKLSENGRKDRVYYLNRSRKIDKLATGGCRSKEVHFESIDVDHTMSVNGEFVLLMDDVTTTGNSLYACKDILINHGAENVEMFALGKSI